MIVEGVATVSGAGGDFGRLGARMSVIERDKPAQRIGPEGVAQVARGRGANLRYVNPIAMAARDVADSLLVTEVCPPDGNWSSYPPHRHDEDDFPRITYLE